MFIKKECLDLDHSSFIFKRELTDTTGVEDYVKVSGGPRGNGGGGCWSMLGRRGGVQHLNLNERNEHCGRTCIIKEVVAHEFLHAFGLGHVQGPSAFTTTTPNFCAAYHPVPHVTTPGEKFEGW